VTPATRVGSAPMYRLLAASLLIGIVAGCGSSGSTASPSPATTPSSATTPSPATTPRPTSVAALVQPSVAPAAFPTAAFAALSDDPVPADLAAKFQAALASLDAAGGGGIAATVMTADGTWSGASGKADGIHDVRPDSQFAIGSVTKTIVAAQLMLLVEAGDVDLDRPATDYLPADFEFDMNGATIRQLLSHRSGIPWWDDVSDLLAKDPTRIWEPNEILAYVPPARGPVDTFDYVDTNYILLGLVIEHVRQRPLFEVLRAGALRVPGTERLIWQPDERPTDPIAMPDGESRDSLDGLGGYIPSLVAMVDGAAGAMASDAISLARWWRAFCAGEVVSQASLTEMSTFYDNAASGLPVDYGLGLLDPADGYSEGGVGHMGQAGAYESWAACLTADDLVVVVLTSGQYDASSIFDLGRPLVTAARSD
jgi:D-alanyl-D-alanine carboxypeptidase